MNKPTKEPVQKRIPKRVQRGIVRPAPMIVAELSANHKQSLQVAKDSIRAIAKSGANAVKLQTYTPECLTLKTDSELFRIQGNTPWDNRMLYDVYEEAQTPWEWHKELFALARELGLIAFSSPFSIKAVEFLESLDCPMYKVASFEVMHYEMIEAIARTRKPIIISTGVAMPNELTHALEICHKHGSKDITLLACVSEYPAPLESTHLLAMPELARLYGEFNVKFGLSDHTIGSLCPVIATSLGATMIEKHFILDKSLGGVDSSFSMDAKEFTEMVAMVKEAHKALGSAKPRLDKEARNRRRHFGRSVWVIKDIAKGETFTRENVSVLRPRGGAHPRYLKQILGSKALCPIKAHMPLPYRAFVRERKVKKTPAI